MFFFLIPYFHSSTTNITTSNPTSNSSGGGGDDHHTGFDERCYNNNKTDRERVSSSHYSTEKSGSSGYYSSSYAAISVDEPIYSEPVTECLHLYGRDKRVYPNQTSNENQTPITPINQSNNNNNNTSNSSSDSGITCCDDESSVKRKPFKLPTIMEGIDGQIPRPVWPSDFDDSLTGVNLESFILPGDQRPRIVEHVTIPDASLNLFVAKNEETTNVQETRDQLEDFREKLNNLLERSIVVEEFQPIGLLPSHLELQIKHLRTEVDEYLRVINQDNELEIKQLCDGLSKNSKMLTMKRALENHEQRKSISSSSIHNYEQNAFNISSSSMSGYEKMMPVKGHMTAYEEVDVLHSQFDTVYVEHGYSVDQQQQKQSPPPRSSTVLRQYSFKSSVADPNFHFKIKQSVNDLTEYVNQQHQHEQHERNERDESSDSVSENSAIQVPIKQKQITKNMTFQHPSFRSAGSKTNKSDKEKMLEWHKNKPSLWELNYGINRSNHGFMTNIQLGTARKLKLKKEKAMKTTVVSYVSLNLNQFFQSY